MSRILNKLSATKVRSAKFSGKRQKLADGGGLYLDVQESGKYWRQKYRFGGKEKTLSHGVFPIIELKEARVRRDDAKKLLAQGIDPGAQKKALKRQDVISEKNTFKSIALEWLEAVHRERVTSGHAHTCQRRLERHIFPSLGSRPISKITPPELLESLRPIAEKGHRETALRVKTLCGQIYRYAVSSGRAERDITADLRDALPPARAKHHPAVIKPREVAELLRAIDGYEGHPSTMAALKLAPLLFVRPGELRTAEWADFDLDKAEWEYTPSKNGKPFVFPLSTQVVSLLREHYPQTGSGRYLFPSIRTYERPMSDNTINAALQRLGYKDVMTGHGFRAMARTVLAEELNFPIEHIEQQLAHAVKDANGRAYNRTTYLKQRREMMQEWADYLERLRSDLF